MAENCSTCKFWASDGKVGECHYDPPRVFPMPTQLGGMQSMSMWPPCSANNWCGKWQQSTQARTDTSSCQQNEPSPLLSLTPKQ